MKRLRHDDEDDEDESDEEKCPELPDDMIKVIIDFCSPSFYNQETCVEYIMLYFTCLSTSRQFNRVTKASIHPQWMIIVPFISKEYNFMHKIWDLPNEPDLAHISNIYKSIAYCHFSIPRAKRELNLFIIDNGIVYRDADNLRVCVCTSLDTKKLKTIVVTDKAISKEFNTRITRYEDMVVRHTKQVASIKHSISTMKK